VYINERNVLRIGISRKYRQKTIVTKTSQNILAEEIITLRYDLDIS